MFLFVRSVKSLVRSPIWRAPLLERSGFYCNQPCGNAHMHVDESDCEDKRLRFGALGVTFCDFAVINAIEAVGFGPRALQPCAATQLKSIRNIIDFGPHLDGLFPMLTPQRTKERKKLDQCFKRFFAPKKAAWLGAGSPPSTVVRSQ